MCQAHKQADNKSNRKEKNANVKKKSENKPRENLTQRVKKTNKKQNFLFSIPMYFTLQNILVRTWIK